MSRPIPRLVALALAAAACARIMDPPGGPPDLRPPVLVSTVPDTSKALPGFDGEVEFQFDETVAEGSSPNFGLGTGDLEKLVLLSPSERVPSVKWRRSRITVRPREGWRPNTLYRVELLPGLFDLRRNRLSAGTVVVFTTGDSLPRRALRGRIVDWTTRRAHPRALVEAMRLPDSLVYRGLADSLGYFTLEPLPEGEYLVYGVLDQNSNFRREPRESWDSARVAAGRDSTGELWMFPHDSTPPRFQSGSLLDSVAVAIVISQQLDPSHEIAADSADVRLLPDSTVVPVGAVLQQTVYDSLYRPAAAAPADSARAAADSARADSIARAREAARLRLPAAEQQRVVPPDTVGRGVLTSRPPLTDRLVVRGGPFRPGARYLVLVRGVRTVSGSVGSVRGVLDFPAAPKPPPDTGAVRRDSAGVRPPGRR